MDQSLRNKKKGKLRSIHKRREIPLGEADKKMSKTESELEKSFARGAASVEKGISTRYLRERRRKGGVSDPKGDDIFFRERATRGREKLPEDSWNRKGGCAIQKKK